MSTSGRRAPVQGDGSWWLPKSRWKKPTQFPGYISWEEHEEVWRAYRARYGNAQDANRIAERGGFGYYELVNLLGHLPKTWVPRESEPHQVSEPSTHEEILASDNRVTREAYLASLKEPENE